MIRSRIPNSPPAGRGQAAPGPARTIPAGPIARIGDRDRARCARLEATCHDGSVGARLCGPAVGWARAAPAGRPRRSTPAPPARDARARARRPRDAGRVVRLYRI